MSALSTPSGGGTTAQSKPASGKQKYQKLDINSLYCTNKNENSEPSISKSQLSRKHGMQSLGKVPSARRPPANLPSLKTETGQDPNSNSISATTTTVSTPATCTSQTITTAPSSGVVAGSAPGGWVPLPPPSSPHFRTEFPSLEAAALPSHRSSEHSANQPLLRPQTEGSWTCGGGAARGDPPPAAAPASAPQQQQPTAFRAILPPFLMKGSSGGGMGLGPMGNMRSGGGGGGGSGSGSATSVSSRGQQGPHGHQRPPATPRAVEVLTQRPILRDEQISSLDDIRDAGWAQHDDIDYNQKLDFSDGETPAPNKGGSKNNNRSSMENERTDSKIEPGDEDQVWAERRQRQNDEVAQAVARAKQRKEEEQRRQMRDAPPSHKDHRERGDRDRDRNDNRDREPDSRDKDRMDRDRERLDNREKDRERNDVRDKNPRDKERIDNRDRDRYDNRDRDRDVRDRDRDRDVRDRDRDRTEFRPRMENRDRQDDKDRMDLRDRDRNDRDRSDRDRFDRDRDRNDRDRNDRDRDFRDRDRDHGRDRDQNNPAFSKTFQANIPPRFLKQQQQQGRQQDDQHNKAWAFTGKPAPRRQEPPAYTAPRHAPHNGGRRSYSRDYSDREDDFRRDKDGSGPQWRSEMQDYDRPGRELDRSNSKDSYKDYGDYKDRRNDSDRKSAESSEHSSRTAADKLSEVFERKSIGLTEPFGSSDSSVQPQAPERRNSPPSNISQRESVERDFGKTSWAEVMQDEQTNYTILKSTQEKVHVNTDAELPKETVHKESEGEPKRGSQLNAALQQSSTLSEVLQPHSQPLKPAQMSTLLTNISSISSTNQLSDSQSVPKAVSQPLSKLPNQTETVSSQMQKPSELPAQNKPTFITQKSEKELSECESVASKSSTDPTSLAANKQNEIRSVESLQVGADSQKRDDVRNDRFSHEQLNRIPGKEPIERKSSGSGSDKKGRGFGGGGGGGGYSVYVRGWGPRESRGRRSHRSSRSKNRASESDGSTDGAPNADRKERRRAPRSPRGAKKQDRPEDGSRPPQEQGLLAPPDGLENREPFAPRGQPSRRGRGGFQGTSRPPAPAKRVTGYGPPNTKSPFSQANRAVKDNDDNGPSDDRGKIGNKNRMGSSARGGRDRRPKAAGGPVSGEDENWETTSEHSEGGGTLGRRRSVGGRQQGQSQKAPQPGRNQNSNNRQNIPRNSQAVKKDGPADSKPDITEAMNDLKLAPTVKKDEETVDDGFQEVRNKKNSKDARGPTKDDNANAQKLPRSHSNQGGRAGSSSRNPNDKSNARGSAPVPAKQGPQYDRPRQSNLAPRFVKQRQKQMGLVTGFGPDTGAAPPPPPVNAWDKPIAQTLRGNVEEPAEVVENKSAQSSQRSTPAEVPAETKPAPCALVADKTGVLDGTTPPVETIIFENTNYKTAPPAEALKQKHQPGAITAAKPPTPEEIPVEVETVRPIPFNGDVRPRPRSIQELIGDNPRPATDGESALGLPISFDTSQKTEDSSDMKLDFAFDSDLGQLTEDKTAKTLGLPRAAHMSTSNTISPLAADLNLKIASVKKVWEMPAVVEGTEELQFAGFEETNTETGAAPNVCKVKPTQQLQSPPPQHYNHVGYQGGYSGLSVPSPPAVLFNSSQQLLGSSQQLPQQGGLYGAFLDQSRGQFGGFPGTPYGAGSAAPYNYQPPPDMFQSLPSQYRMAAAAASGGAGFGQSGQLGNSPSTVLISSSTNSLMSATVKPSNQQIGAIGSKGGGVGGVGGVNTYQQQYLGYSGPVGEAQYSLPGLLPRPAPPASSYYSPYQPPAAPAPTYPLQFTPPAQSGAFGSQFLSSQQLQVAAAVQQMQQQYRAPMQQQYAPPQPPPRPPPQLKSPLHEHSANGFAPLPLGDNASPSPKGAPPPAKGQKPPHSPPQHKYHAPPPHQQHQQHHHPHHPQHHHPHQQQMMGGGNNARVGNNGGAMGRGGMVAPRYPAPIQRPHAPALPLFRPPQAAMQPRPHHQQHQQQQPPRHNVYYQHHQRNGAGVAERAAEGDVAPPADEPAEVAVPDAPPASEVKAD